MQALQHLEIGMKSNKDIEEKSHERKILNNLNKKRQSNSRVNLFISPVSFFSFLGK